MSNRPEACVGAVARRDDQLLMIRRGQGPADGTWSLPGGRIEFGETAAEAVVRELSEETGLAGSCGPLIGWVEIIEAGFHYVVLDFDVTIIDDAEPIPGDDAREAAWVPLWKVSELDTSPGLAEFLADHGIIDLLI
jgi:8-oxo-dGTP diphosphatase